MNRRRAARPAERKPEIAYVRLSVDQVYTSSIGRRMMKESGVVCLAASIACHGLLQPIVVRKNAEFDRYTLICGARRLMACRMLGMKTIDAVVLNIRDEEAAACFIEEHLSREPVHFLDDAAMIEEIGTDKVRAAFALPEHLVDERMEMLALEENVRRRIAETEMTLEQAKPLLSLAPYRQMEAAEVIAGRALTPTQAWRLVERADNSCTSGKKRSLRMVLAAISAALKSVQAQGIGAEVSMHSRKDGVCVQILIRENGNREDKQHEAPNAGADRYTDERKKNDICMKNG